MYKTLISLAIASLTLATSVAHAGPYQLRFHSKGVRATMQGPGNPGPSTPSHAAFTVRSLDWGDAPSKKTVYVTNYSSDAFMGYLSAPSLLMDWQSTCQGEGAFYLAPGETCTGIFSLDSRMPAGTVISESIRLVDTQDNTVDSLTATGRVGTVALGELDNALASNYTQNGSMRWGDGYLRLGDLRNVGNTQITATISSSGQVGLRFSRAGVPSYLAAGASTSLTLMPGETVIIETNLSEWPAHVPENEVYTTNASYTLAAPGVSRTFNITFNMQKN